MSFQRTCSRREVLATAAGLTVVGVGGLVIPSARRASAVRVGAGEPRQGGTLTIIRDGEQAAGWDPLRLRGVLGTPENPIGFSLYDVLLYQDITTGELVHRLAESLTSPDGVVWTLKLKPDVSFQDGTPFDAEAVRYNWERIANPDNQALALSSAALIESVEITDPLTLTLTLGAPEVKFDVRVAYNLATIASPTAIEAAGEDYGNQPVGAGPFRIEEWTRDSRYRLVRNPDYWQEGRPYIDELVVNIISDPSQALNTFQAGQANIITVLPFQAVEESRQAGGTIVVSQPQGGGFNALMNNSRPPFDDPRVRKAVDLALDRQRYNETADFGLPELLMTTVHTESSPFYDETVRVPETDLEAAQALLDEVVAETGGPIEFTITTYPVGQVPAEVVQAQLMRLDGVDVTVEVLPGTDSIRRYATGEYQMGNNAVRWNEPAIEFVNWFKTGSSLNWARYTNAEVDAAIDELVVATGEQERKSLVNTILGHVLEDSALAFYSRKVDFMWLDETVQNFANYYDQGQLTDQVWIAED